jgi:hypothetical protein
MGIALSLLVVIGGAVLRYGVTVSPHGLNLPAIGMILIVAGGIGFAASALWMAGQWPFARRTVIREREVLEREPAETEHVLHEQAPVHRHEHIRHERSA